MLTKEQKENRKNAIGGTDIAAIIGCSPYKTATCLYLEKTGQVEEEKDNLRLRFGKESELFVLNEYNRKTGKNARNFENSIFDSDHSCLIANIDAFNEDDCIVEAKTASYNNSWGEGGTAEIPDHYLCQVAHYVAIADCEYADIPVLFLKGSSIDFKIYHYTRSEKLESLLREKALEFWSNVIKRIPPSPTSRSDIELIYRDQGTSIEANNETIESIEELRDIKEVIKSAKEKESKLKDRISVYMGSSSILKNNNHILLTYKDYKSPEKFDKTRFKKDHPKMAENYISQNGTYRKMMIK